MALLAANPALFAAPAFLFGLVIGSFLNVVIHRLPLMLERQWRAQAADLEGRAMPADGEAYDLAAPRSRCPTCQAPIRGIHNIPVLSYLALQGRCASCRAPISIRYPLVELATGIAFAAVAWHFGFGLTAGLGLVFTAYLIALTGIDVDRQLLPDILTVPLLWIALIASLWQSTGGSAPPAALRDAVIGAVAGYGFLWLVFQLFKLATGKEGMGYGDFKLFAAIGAWLGWQMLPLVLLLAAVVCAAVGISLLAVAARRGAAIPFGPYSRARLDRTDVGAGDQGPLPRVRGPRLNAMLRIGLTGGIASGKTTVASLFAARGAVVLDTDQIAREVVLPGKPSLAALVQALGSGILDRDGRLDRAALRRRLFADEATRRKVEAVLHPEILAELERQSKTSPGPYQVFVIPLLVESHLERVVDRILVVDCPEEDQVRRLMARDGESRESALGMLRAQASREERLALTDDVVDNGGDSEALPAQVASLDRKYRELAPKH